MYTKHSIQVKMVQSVFAFTTIFLYVTLRITLLELEGRVEEYLRPYVLFFIEASIIVSYASRVKAIQSSFVHSSTLSISFNYSLRKTNTNYQ